MPTNQKPRTIPFSGPLEAGELALHLLAEALTRWVYVTQAQLDGLLKDYVGRESPLYFAERLSEHLGNDVQVGRCLLPCPAAEGPLHCSLCR